MESDIGAKQGKGKSASPWRLVPRGTGPAGGQLFQHVRDQNRWNVKVFAGRDAKGKKRYVSKVVYGSKKDANAMLLDLLHKKSRRQLPRRSSLTYEQLVESWLAQKTDVSPRTHNGYKQLLERHVLPSLGHKRVSSLRHEDFSLLYAAMADGTHLKKGEPANSKPRPLKSRTVRLTHVAVMQSLAHAVTTSVLVQHPVGKIKFSKPDSKERTHIAPGDLSKFVEACEHSEYGVFYLLLVHTGLRPGEACALMWEDINFERLEVKVTKTVTRHADGQPRITTPKTKRSMRKVAMMKELADALMRHRHLQVQLGHTALGHVFTNRSGGMLKPWTFNKRDLRRTATAAGIASPVSLYTLRHTFATSHLDTGTPLKQVSAWMGHSSIVQTGDTYMHAADDTGQKWMQQHEARLRSTTGREAS